MGKRDQRHAALRRDIELGAEATRLVEENAAIFETDDSGLMYEGRRLSIDVETLAVLLRWCADNPLSARTLSDSIGRAVAAAGAEVSRG